MTVFVFLTVSHLRDMEFCSYIDHYQSYSGFTPLHYAVIADNLEMVKYLLENGADPSIENNRGFLPEDYTTNEDIANLLKKSAKEVRFFFVFKGEGEERGGGRY